MPGPKLIIATLNATETYAVRLLTTAHATSGDYITALLPHPTPAASRHAWLSLSTLAQRLGLKTLQPTAIPTSDVINTLTAAANAIVSSAREAGASHVIIEATDGPQPTSAALLLASILLNPRLHIDYYLHDTTTLTPIRIDHKLINTISTKHSKERIEIIITVIENPGITIHQLAQRLNKHKKTTQNLVAQLKRQGLLVQKGRKGGLYPTKLAEIIKLIAQ